MFSQGLGGPRRERLAESTALRELAACLVAKVPLRCGEKNDYVVERLICWHSIVKTREVILL